GEHEQLGQAHQRDQVAPGDRQRVLHRPDEGRTPDRGGRAGRHGDGGHAVTSSVLCPVSDRNTSSSVGSRTSSVSGKMPSRSSTRTTSSTSRPPPSTFTSIVWPLTFVGPTTS